MWFCILSIFLQTAALVASKYMVKDIYRSFHYSAKKKYIYIYIYIYTIFVKFRYWIIVNE